MPSAFFTKSVQLVGAVGATKAGVAGVGVGLEDSAGTGFAVLVGLGDGTEIGLVATEVPLFQISFLPDLIHVYLIFEIVFVEFILVQEAPEIEAEFAGISEKTNVKLKSKATVCNLLRNMEARIATNTLKVAVKWSVLVDFSR